MRHDETKDRHATIARGKRIGEGCVQGTIIFSIVLLEWIGYQSAQSQSILAGALAVSISLAGLCFSYARVIDADGEEFAKMVGAGEHFFRAAGLFLFAIAHGYVSMQCESLGIRIIPRLTYGISILACIGGTFYFQDGYKRISVLLYKRTRGAGL